MVADNVDAPDISLVMKAKENSSRHKNSRNLTQWIVLLYENAIYSVKSKVFPEAHLIYGVPKIRGIVALRTVQIYAAIDHQF